MALAGALCQRERNFRAVKNLIGVFVILAVLCAAVLLSAGEARAQTLEDETPVTNPAPESVAPEPATTEPATTEPVPSTDIISDPAPNTPPPTTDPPPAPEPDPVAEPAPEPAPVLAVERTPVAEPTPIIEPPPVLEPTPEPIPEPIPVTEPATDSVSPTMSEAIPNPEPTGLDPTISEPGLPPAPTELAPALAPTATLKQAPIVSPVSQVPAASDEPVSAPTSEPRPLAASAVFAVPPAEPPTGPPEDGGRTPKLDASFATPVTDAADSPDGGFGDARVFGQDGQDGQEVANLPQSLANHLMETASALFGPSSETVARITRQADRMATVLLRAATHLIENLTNEQGSPIPAQPARNTPSPAVPPAPVPVPVGGGASCGSSGGSWECQNDAHYALLIGVLAGAFALGIPKRSTRFFHEAFKPDSILPQVAERPG